jgi:hypothetical protein
MTILLLKIKLMTAIDIALIQPNSYDIAFNFDNFPHLR